MGQIRINRGRAIAKECGKVVYLPGLPGFEDQGHGRALLCVNEVLMHGRNSQEGGKRHMVLVHSPVRKDQNISSLPVCLVHFHKQMCEHPLHGRSLVEQGGHPGNMKTFFFQGFNLDKVKVAEDRILNLQYMAVLRSLLQQIAVCAQIHGTGGDNLLPVRIDGWIRHLCK